ncbi:hypothetical protein LCGC14_0925320 [marine sediment metagenome]|uniref:Uncharacterized protein n=1 Tax=marine sediment metagenome TaxID=412755 RepID=A0A0F9R8B8_9ZZZZ
MIDPRLYCADCEASLGLPEEEAAFLEQVDAAGGRVTAIRCPGCASKYPDDDKTVPYDVAVKLLAVRQQTNELRGGKGDGQGSP